MPPQLGSCHSSWNHATLAAVFGTPAVTASQSCATSATDIGTPASLAMGSGILCVSCYTSHELQKPAVCCATLAVGSRTMKRVPYYDPEHMHNSWHNEVGCELHSQTT